MSWELNPEELPDDMDAVTRNRILCVISFQRMLIELSSSFTMFCVKTLDQELFCGPMKKEKIRVAGIVWWRSTASSYVDRFNSLTLILDKSAGWDSSDKVAERGIFELGEIIRQHVAGIQSQSEGKKELDQRLHASFAKLTAWENVPICLVVRYEVSSSSTITLVAHHPIVSFEDAIKVFRADILH